MIAFVERYFANLGRDLKDPAYSFRVKGIIFIICVVFFGIFGALPAYRTVQAERKTIKELETLSIDTARNLQRLKAVEADIDTNADLIAYLDKYLPVEAKTQDYMVDFIGQATDEGFFVKNFTEVSGKKITGQMEIAVLLEGNKYPTDLIRDVETLKRVTQVKNVNLYKTNTGVFYLDILLVVYTAVL